MLLRAEIVGWLLVASVSAAYVQWQHCDGWTSAPATASLQPVSLRASMEPKDDGQRLTLQMQFYDEPEKCSTLPKGTTVNLNVQALGGREFRNIHEASFECDTDRALLLVDAAFEDISRPYPLSTFYAEAVLNHPSHGPIGCVASNITPELGAVTSGILRWAPFSIFMAILLMGISITVHDQKWAMVDQVAEETSARHLLPGVGDCLQYLQFVFLTGSLSLRYPGFYQPAVSKLGWFSLFVRGPISRYVVYKGVNDGIYEINGTYGGTFGLELMHQIVGAPTTMDTWINMVLALMMVAVGAAILLECLRIWQRRSSAHVFLPTSPQNDNLQLRFGRVLRVIFSYFTTPIVAISTYQFANATRLPSYHTALATVLVAIVIGGFVWLFYQVPTRSLGALIFNRSNRYRQIPTESSSDHLRHDHFVLILFTVAFVRGIAIGGVQIFGPAQLAILGACELVLMTFIFGYQAYPAFSVNTISCGARLLSLLLMVFFLPNLLGLKAKSAVGYTVLAIHGTMLLFGFLWVACYDFWRVCQNWPAIVERDSVSLQILRQYDDPAVHHASPSPRNYSPHSPVSPYGYSAQRPESPFTWVSGSPSEHGRFFRPPRPNSLHNRLSVDNFSPAASRVFSDSPSRKSPPSSSSEEGPVSGIFGSSVPHMHDHTPSSTHHVRRGTSSEMGRRLSSSYQKSQTRSSQSNSDEGPEQRAPLGPRWNDYTFRESDLFYAVPQQGPRREWGNPTAATGPTKGPAFNMNNSILRASSAAWARLTGRGVQEPVERGFQVSRPGNLERIMEARPPGNEDHAGNDLVQSKQPGND